MIVKPERKLWTPPRSRVMPRSWYRQRGFFTPMGFTTRAVKVDAADFPGDLSNFMTRGAGLTGAADSKTGIFSVSLRFDVNQVGYIGAAPTAVGGSTVRFFVSWAGNAPVRVVGRNAAGTDILDVRTSSSFGAGATWRNFLFSWDLATATVHSYVADVSDISVVTATNDTIDHTVADFVIGRFPSASNGFNGCMAEYYFAPGQYLDFSVVANRRKFISSSGKPVPLGTNGLNPTGVAPLVYQHLGENEAVANFATNRGTGGNLTITGTLGAASTSPSD